MLKKNFSTVRKSLTDFLLEEVRKAGFKKGVVGMSGGVDSSVAAYLAASALGKENVIGMILPYKTSSRDSVADAKMVIKKLGIKNGIVEITPMADAYFLKHPAIDNIRRGNILARLRMIIMYDMSAREKALVIGTSNKTEILLGYGTIFGDTACAINPLGGLYKTQVWQLAKYLGVPGEIIKKAPTADLWQGQTDEGELGFSYRAADRLLFYMIDRGYKVPALMKLGFEKDFIARVRQLIQQNKFKQRLPKIARITGRINF